jgi:mannosyltransferase
MLPEPAPLSQRRYWSVAVVIVLLAAVLRFWHLGVWSMWVDEGMTYLRAGSGNLSDQGPLYATAPLNFLATRWFITAYGSTLFWLRFFPAVCGVLGVVALMWAGQRLGGRTMSLVAGLLLALSPWHIDWSQNARHFSAVFLFAVICVTAFYLFWESGRLGWLVTAALAAGLGLLTHSSMLFVVGALGLYAATLVLVPSLRAAVVTRRKVVAAGVFFVVIAGGYAPVALAVSRYLGQHKAAWNPPSNVAASILFYAGPLEITVALAAGLALLRRRRNALLLTHWMVWPMVCVVLAASRTISSGAYALPALAAIYLLLALFVADLFGRGEIGVAGTVLAGLVAQLALRTGLYYTAEQGNRPPWREASEWVQRVASPGDQVFSTEGVVMGYYLHDAARATWTDGWTAPAPGRTQWLLVLTGDDAAARPPLGPFLAQRCQLRQVFARNTGPKRRDIEGFRCE